jgi:hypothetical protein
MKRGEEDELSWEVNDEGGSKVVERGEIRWDVDCGSVTSVGKRSHDYLNQEGGISSLKTNPLQAN